MNDRDRRDLRRRSTARALERAVRATRHGDRAPLVPPEVTNAIARVLRAFPGARVRTVGR